MEFGPADLPQLPIKGCPFKPHCFCCYSPRVHDREPHDDRPQAEKDAEFDALLKAMPPAAAAEVVRLLNASLAGFGLPPYRLPK